MRTRIAALAAAVAVLLGGCADGGAAPDPTPTSEERVTSPEPSRPAGTPSSGPTPPASAPAGAPAPSEAPAPPERSAPARPPSRATPLPPSRTKPAPTVIEGELTISGELVEGVEPRCLLLRSGAAEYLVVAGPQVDRSALTPGTRVTVRGRLAPDLLSTCQQGAPLIVTEVRPG